MIHVCPLSRLDETLAATGARHLISLLCDERIFVRPAPIAETNHLHLQVHDIIEACPGMTEPCADHVSTLLAFAREWACSGPLVVHCVAGISRSTAAAYTIAAALAPEQDEAELAWTLRRLSPTASPNIRLVALADELLGRSGRMTAAIRQIGRGVEAVEGTPFQLPLDRTRSVSIS